MSSLPENRPAKPNQPQTKPQYSLENYYKLQARRQNVPPRFGEGGSRLRRGNK